VVERLGCAETSPQPLLPISPEWKGATLLGKWGTSLLARAVLLAMVVVLAPAAMAGATNIQISTELAKESKRNLCGVARPESGSSRARRIGTAAKAENC
jgi:hypothetical protein